MKGLWRTSIFWGLWLFFAGATLNGGLPEQLIPTDDGYLAAITEQEALEELAREKLNAQYIQGLKRLEKYFADRGELTETLMVQKELKLAETQQALLPLASDTPENLKRMRAQYQKQAVSIQREFARRKYTLAKTYATKLQGFEAALTKARKFEEAVVVQERAVEVVADLKSFRPSPSKAQPTVVDTTPVPNVPPAPVTTGGGSVDRVVLKLGRSPGPDRDLFRKDVKWEEDITIQPGVYKWDHTLRLARMINPGRRLRWRPGGPFDLENSM